jgi:hypothetical protein
VDFVIARPGAAIDEAALLAACRPERQARRLNHHWEAGL